MTGETLAMLEVWDVMRCGCNDEEVAAYFHVPVTVARVLMRDAAIAADAPDLIPMPSERE